MKLLNFDKTQTLFKQFQCNNVADAALKQLGALFKDRV